MWRKKVGEQKRVIGRSNAIVKCCRRIFLVAAFIDRRTRYFVFGSYGYLAATFLPLTRYLPYFTHDCHLNQDILLFGAVKYHSIEYS